MRHPGLVIFVKSNLPEFALKAVTHSKLFGRSKEHGVPFVLYTGYPISQSRSHTFRRQS